MRDVFILGSGRSGTSLVAGCLHRAGYFQGAAPHPARDANPKGFFESAEINDLNEELLAKAVLDPGRWRKGWRWLARLDPTKSLVATPDQERRIAALTAHRPFCYKDPRFSFTLPIWRRLAPSDARPICVFRHPWQTVTSMARECAKADYLRGLDWTEAEGMHVWFAQHAALLQEADRTKDFVFVHYEDVLEGPGLERIEEAVEARVDRSFPDADLHRHREDRPLPARVEVLYRELCRRAGRLARTAVSVPSLEEDGDLAPRVSLVVEAARAETLDPSWKSLAADPRVQVVVLGERRGHGLARADFVSAESPVERERWRATENVVRAAAVLFGGPGPAPALDALLAMARQLEQTPSALACTAAIADRAGGPARSSLELGLEGVLFRREALAGLDGRAFFPARLALADSIAESGRAASVDAVLQRFSDDEHARASAGATVDRALIALHAAAGAVAPDPVLSVLISSYARKQVLLRSLASFCRQLVPWGSFEIVVSVDESGDGTTELLASLEWPVPVTFLARPKSDLAAARNATVAKAKGDYLLVVNDDTIAWPDLVEQHLRAHRRAGREVAVLGTFDQPPDVLRKALARVMEHSSFGFPYRGMVDGGTYNWHKFWTCNVSVPAKLVREVGGFDESFEGYGCEDSDLGLRLGERGLPVRFHAAARAFHDHVLDLPALARRQKGLASANVRFFLKHPDELAGDPWRGFLPWDEERCRRFVAESRAAAGVLVGVAGSLADVDLAALEAAGDDGRKLASSIQRTLENALHQLDQYWWKLGFLEGFARLGVHGFAEIAARAAVMPSEERLCAS